MALRFGGSKRFDTVKIATFCRLDEKLGAKADLGDVVRTLITQVNAEWPQAASILAERSELCWRIESFIKERASRLTR